MTGIVVKKIIRDMVSKTTPAEVILGFYDMFGKEQSTMRLPGHLFPRDVVEQEELRFAHKRDIDLENIH